MNKLMKKTIAALLALSCLPVTALSAAAKGLPMSWYWGSTTWDSFEDLELIGQGERLGRTVQLYVQKDANISQAVSVTPRMDYLRFELREDAEADAELKAFEIVAKYIPGEIGAYFQEAHCTRIVDENGGIMASINRESDRVYDVYVTCDTSESGDAWEAGILIELARAHLISAYYGWGESADYSVSYFNGLKRYQETMQVLDGQPGQYKNVPIDWNAVQLYLDEHHPGYQVEKNLLATINERDNDGNDHFIDYYEYNINTAEWLCGREQLLLMCELWEQFGIFPALLEPDCTDQPEPLTGHNALLQPGDATLDTDISITDVIALNRSIMSGDHLCDTAKQNADINLNGMPDETDSLDLLKYIVGINESLT